MAEITIDESKIQEMIDKQVAEALKAQPVPQVIEDKSDPLGLGKVFNPYIEPVNQKLDNIALQSQLNTANAIDYAKFMGKHGGKLSSEELEEVEGKFNEYVKAGRPTSREDIRKYLFGSKIMDDPDKFVEAELQKRKLAAKEAEKGVDVGTGGISKIEREGTPVDFEKANSDEMAKAMEGFTF